MRHIITFIAVLALQAGATAQRLYFPPLSGGQWQRQSPASLGWCEGRIAALYNYLEAEETRSFVVLKKGRIVLERYFNGHAPNSQWPWYSAGKSLRAVLVGIAQQSGALAIGDPTSRYLGPGWTSMGRARENAITVRDQLAMTTGLNERFFACTAPVCLRYRADPGTRWAYHNSPYNLLKDVLESATGATLNAYTTTMVKRKIGMGTGNWVPSGNNVFFYSTARDMARFGLMVQNKGYWGRTPVLADRAYFNQMTNSTQALNPSYGYLWWLNGKRFYLPPGNSGPVNGPIAPDAPADMLTAAGARGQFISIAPSSGLVVVRQGNAVDNDLAALPLLNEIWKRIGNLACGNTLAESTPTLAPHPNPATETLRIGGLDGAGAHIVLRSLYGLPVKAWDNTATLDVGDVSKGTYLLQIFHEGKTTTHRVVLE